jgi:metal-responsive CopG/Arc/MetJ family transcriptional regulator
MKVAISVPDPVFEAADRLAKQRHVPRSQLFSEALQEYLLITTRLNEVYAVQDSVLDEHLAFAQFAATADEAW